MTSLGESMEPLAILFLAIKQHIIHHVQAPFELIAIPNPFHFCQITYDSSTANGSLSFPKDSQDQVTYLALLCFGL